MIDVFSSTLSSLTRKVSSLRSRHTRNNELMRSRCDCLMNKEVHHIERTIITSLKPLNTLIHHVSDM